MLRTSVFVAVVLAACSSSSTNAATGGGAAGTTGGSAGTSGGGGGNGGGGGAIDGGGAAPNGGTGGGAGAVAGGSSGNAGDAGIAGGDAGSLTCMPDAPQQCTHLSADGCTCLGCNTSCNDAEPVSDCICAVCSSDTYCASTCNNDNVCDPYRETCQCPDCALHPLCQK